MKALGRNNQRSLLAALVAGCLLLPVSAPAESAPEARFQFATALEAARSRQWQELDWLQTQLGEQHPLQGYLDFHRLLAKLPDAPTGDILDYMDRYRHLPIAADMREQALARLGKNGDWKKIRALQKDAPRSLALQCYFHRAWLEQRPQASREAGRRLWLSGQSRPPACDPLFEALTAAGVIDDDLVWQRIQLAFQAKNPGLVRYLGGKLQQRYKDATARLQQLFRDPEAELEQIADGYPGVEPALLARLALHRLADLSPVEALRWIKSPRGRELKLDEEKTRADLERRIAWFMTIRGETQYRHWLDSWLLHNRDSELLEQRARLAVREQDWQALPGWIARLPVAGQRSAQWQYWLARAWRERDEPELGREALQAAARQRSFFGFAAARLLGRDYPLNLQTPQLPSAEQQSTLAESEAVERVLLLRQAGEFHLARREWFHALYRSGLAPRAAWAGFAMREGWHDLAVSSALHEHTRDVLSWRFPAAFREQFFQQASAQQLDPWLAMAVARRESSYNPQARSHAGALGLMQVMPATARQLSQRLSMEQTPDTDALLEPDLSIRLGSAFLGELLERYQGNRIKALAAYNAGPHRVDNWLPEEPVPYDVWIESIPFHETRDYVRAVLTYRLILAHLHGDEEQQELVMIEEHERQPVGPRGEVEIELSRR